MTRPIDLQAITDHILGVLPPRVGHRTSFPSWKDRALALAMLVTSAAATFGAAGLCALGHPIAGIRVFCGAVLILAVLLRLP
jgi:hypothetical protein